MALDDPFDIILLSPGPQRYYPASMSHEDWMGEHHVPHDKLDIPLGQSRYGGPVIDLPPDTAHPNGLRFAAQLNLADLAPHDKRGLLPKRGHLFVFSQIETDTGLVVYSDTPTEGLCRTIVEHEDNFFESVPIEKFGASQEHWRDRFREADEDDEEKGLVWDEFAGSDVSKVYGIMTRCQWDRTDIEAVMASGMVVLLQIGEGGFNDEGVFTVLIREEDLVRKDFSRCQFHWGQT